VFQLSFIIPVGPFIFPVLAVTCPHGMVERKERSILDPALYSER
jgi:hypothetical protein